MGRCRKSRYVIATALAFVLFRAHPAFAADQSLEPFRDYRARFYGFGEGLAVAALASGKTRLLRTEPNIHDSTADRLELVSWGGMELTVRHITSAPDKPMFERLVVRGKKVLFVYDLEIGTSTPRNVEDALGPPHRRTSIAYTYQGLSEICEDSYSFHFKQNRLVRVEWEWCGD